MHRRILLNTTSVLYASKPLRACDSVSPCLFLSYLDCSFSHHLTIILESCPYVAIYRLSAVREQRLVECKILSCLSLARKEKCGHIVDVVDPV